MNNKQNDQSTSTALASSSKTESNPSELLRMLLNDGSVARYSNSKPLITAKEIVNAVSALLVSCMLTAAAMLADMLGCMIYCLAKHSSPHFHNMKCFSLIAEISSIVLGSIMLFMLAYSKLLSKAILEGDPCAEMSIRALVFSDLVANTGLGFLGYYFSTHEKHPDLVRSCVWSKVIGLGLLALVGLGLWVSKGDRYLGRRLHEFREAFFNTVERGAGPESSFHQAGGCKERLMRCASFFASSNTGESVEEQRTVGMSPVVSSPMAFSSSSAV